MNSRLQIDPAAISAEVYFENDKGVYYVKVTIPNLSMYINSFQVKPSPRYPDRGLWVQWPSFMVGGRWIKPIEFRGDSELKGLVEDEILRAVDSYSKDRLIPGDTPV